jgi:alpha-1,3-fucosyltransferase
MEMTKHKNITVGWMVSNCKSKSKREEYAAKLKEYITVDIYGRCGTLKCSSCDEMLQKKYW